MPLTFDVARIRALAERLIAIPSVSPDPVGENRAIRAVAEALPARVERGEWPMDDGRHVLWAFVPGRTPHAVVMLAHADTVGVDEYAGLGAPEGAGIVFDTRTLVAWLLARAESLPHSLPPNVLAP